jgi:hypothetical protein
MSARALQNVLHYIDDLLAANWTNCNVQDGLDPEGPEVDLFFIREQVVTGETSLIF